MAISAVAASSSPIEAQNSNVHTSFLWHLHQPIYWPDKRAGTDHYENAWDTIQAQDAGRAHPSPEVLRQVFGLDDRIAAYQNRPKDALDSIAGTGSGQLGLAKAGVQLNYSGALMENIQSLGSAGQLGYGGNWFQGDKNGKAWLTSGGKPHMDLTNFTYHHSLAPLLSDETLEMELRIHQRHMQLLWGDPVSRGYFPAETCFSERMIPILKKVGIAWSIIANNHLSRACADFPLVLGSGGENCDIPNKADQINPAQVNYQRLTIDRGVSPAAALPFAFQIHQARYVDPATGAESKIVVVPSDQALGWKDSYSTWDIGLISPLRDRNNPLKPSLVLVAHDGDNAWSGGYSYYMEWVKNFVSQITAANYEATTVEQFLQDWPADPNDVVHVEDGGWMYADGDFGSPMFVNWHFPPSFRNSSNVNVVDPSTGVSDKADVWRVIVATENRVKTAQQIGVVAPRIDQVRDPGSFSGTPTKVELGWHYYLAGLDSGFVYYGCHDDECQRPVIAQTNAEREIGSVIVGHETQDTTPPTLFLPQRHPWNPGNQNYGVQYSYKATTPPNTDFWVWTYAYDVSGVANVVLKFRSNGNNHPPTQDQFKTYAGGANTGAWNSITMTKRVANPVIGATPQFIADYYYAKVIGLSDTYADYYVSATDARGNTLNSPIQHVYVAVNPTATPTPTPSATPTPIPGATPIPFTLDGQADAAGYLEYNNGMTIYAAVRGGILYLATWSPGNSGGANDHFIFVTDQLLPSAAAAAPWAKAGLVATAATKPFIGGESLSSFCGWFNAPASAKVVKSVSNGGQMEGTIDLLATFGSVPNTIYVAAAAYATANGGALTVEAPIGNGDGNIDPAEFMPLSIAAIRDENGDGKYDRLDPALDFVVAQITRTNGTTTIKWNSVPGKNYQVETAGQLGGTWGLLGGPMMAGPGQLTLSADDPSGVLSGFFRVRLLNP